MSFSPYKGSRDFISVSMPWKADKDDHNSKSRRHTSIYRVNKPAVMIMLLLWWRSEHVFCVCLYLGNFLTISLVADNRQQHVLKYPSSQFQVLQSCKPYFRVVIYSLIWFPWHNVVLYRVQFRKAGKNDVNLNFQYFKLTTCTAPMDIFNNYSSSPNGLWVGRMCYWLRGHEGERNNCFSNIQLVGQKYRE